MEFYGNLYVPGHLKNILSNANGSAFNEAVVVANGGADVNSQIGVSVEVWNMEEIEITTGTSEYSTKLVRERQGKSQEVDSVVPRTIHPCNQTIHRTRKEDADHPSFRGKEDLSQKGEQRYRVRESPISH